MVLYTIQMGKWRKAKEADIPFFDITLKSGEKAFAPSPALLGDYKSGRIDDAEYTRRFYQEMRVSYHRYPALWEHLIHRPVVAIACYCAPGKFCHRHLIRDMVEKLCIKFDIPYEYKGEIGHDTPTHS